MTKSFLNNLRQSDRQVKGKKCRNRLCRAQCTSEQGQTHQEAAKNPPVIIENAYIHIIIDVYYRIFIGRYISLMIFCSRMDTHSPIEESCYLQ